MNRFHLYIPLLLLAILAFGCGESTAPTEEAVSDSKSETERTQATTQAILKVQKITFDPTKKSAILAPYQSVDQLVIPENLVPQNKWFMFEGPVLENSQIAYRFYGDYRHRTDIYGKRVTQLVMDTVGWDYHDIQDWGSDILKVGNSLGIGSPALYYQDSIYTFDQYEQKTIQVIPEEDGAGFLFRFTGMSLGGETFDLEQRWILPEDTPYAQVQLKLTKGTLPAQARFCTGIVKHLDQAKFLDATGRQVMYTYGKQSFHKQLLGMAVVVDQQIPITYLDHSLSHVWLFPEEQSSVSYQFAAAWEADVQGVKDEGDFVEMLQELNR